VIIKSIDLSKDIPSIKYVERQEVLALGGILEKDIVYD
jgi:hypothetical protein